MSEGASPSRLFPALGCTPQCFASKWEVISTLKEAIYSNQASAVFNGPLVHITA